MQCADPEARIIKHEVKVNPLHVTPPQAAASYT